MDISWLILEEDGKSHAPNDAFAGRSKILLLKSTGLWNAIIHQINRQNILILTVCPNSRLRYFLIAGEFSLGPSAMHLSIAKRLARGCLVRGSHSSRFQPLLSAVFVTRTKGCGSAF
ncbi:hypothetical protein [Rhizobium sp. WSM1325]|uniref:hypothetical protein n=1 Tax=Rhizobium sp. WSM1325 TaxID=3444086 RepID=UPI0013E34288|nr:hypothetical protein [Rhizobium leguminosarum]